MPNKESFGMEPQEVYETIAKLQIATGASVVFLSLILGTAGGYCLGAIGGIAGLGMILKGGKGWLESRHK